MLQVDLNPIRVGVAKTPEESDFTRVQERIANLSEEPSAEKLEGETILDPESNTPGQMDKIRDNTKTEMWLHPFCEGKLSGHDSILSLPLEDYLNRLYWSGRQIVEGKRVLFQAV